MNSKHDSTVVTRTVKLSLLQIMFLSWLALFLMSTHLRGHLLRGAPGSQLKYYEITMLFHKQATDWRCCVTRVGDYYISSPFSIAVILVPLFQYQLSRFLFHEQFPRRWGCRPLLALHCHLTSDPAAIVLIFNTGNSCLTVLLWYSGPSTVPDSQASNPQGHVDRAPWTSVGEGLPSSSHQRWGGRVLYLTASCPSDWFCELHFCFLPRETILSRKKAPRPLLPRSLGLGAIRSF